MKQTSRDRDITRPPHSPLPQYPLVKRGIVLLSCGLLTGPALWAQAPTATPAPEPAPAANPAPAVAPNTNTPALDGPPPAPPQQLEIPTPPPPSLRDMVNSLSQNDIQEAITALRGNFIDQNALSEIELNRAALEGLISRLDHGAILEQPGGTSAPTAASAGFLAEILDNRIGYIRLGALSSESIGQLDAALKTAVERQIPAVALDLRGTAESSDYALAEQVVSRFAPKGRPLFTIKRPGAKQEQIFTSKADPAFTGFVVILVDEDTAGAAETIAGAIRQQARSLVVGANTQGRAVEYSNVQLSNGKTMRIATGSVVLPPDIAIFPNGIAPDLGVALPAEEQEAIFRGSQVGGMSQFVFEAERPRLNEAALVAGTNPTIDAYQESRRNPGSGRAPLRDTVLQRALDVVTSIQVIEMRTPPAGAPGGPGIGNGISPESVPSPEAQGQPDPPERDGD